MAALAILTAGVVRQFIFSNHVPEEFSEARIKGAKIAEEIIAQQAFTSRNLEQIAKYDKQKNTSEALILISTELLKNREAGQKAIQLSSQLEKMASEIISIRPSKARDVATAAVTSEVTLVSRLLTYNNYLSQLFEVLRGKFETGISGNGKVKDLITKINDEVGAINELDKRFHDSLAEFDSLVIK